MGSHEKVIAAALVALTLASCAGPTGSTQSLKPVCKALEEPFEYDRTDKNSPIHAGPALAPRLAEHNRVGVNLDCPAYR